MMELSEWARDLLMSRGALVESEGDGALRALLPAEVSARLAVGDWLSLDFGARVGADDSSEWQERLSTLLPPSPAVAGARLRQRTVAGPIDAEAVPYYLFSFEYTVESDERTIGYARVCLNGASRSLVGQPERLLHSIQDDLEEDPVSSDVSGPLGGLYLLASRAAQAEVRDRIAALEQSANRRLARDSERMASYYGGLLAQIEKWAARRDAAEKDRSRIEATRLDRAAKMEDLVRKYSLRVQLELTDVLAVRLPARAISARLVRKKEERLVTLHWNAVLRALDMPLCEYCSGRARPLFLCEKVHLLCGACWSACPACGRVFCRVCQRACKCGAKGSVQ